MDPSIILVVYTPQIIEGHGSVNYFGVYTSKIIDGHASVNYLGDRPVIWGVYTSKIIDGHGSVNFFGALHLQNN